MDGCDHAATAERPVARPARPTTLLDVLRELDVRALDTLHDHLRGPFVSVVRLACRALRQAVDGSVRTASITVTRALAHHWKPGTPPVLARFPRCHSVNIDLCEEEESEDSEDEEERGFARDDLELATAAMALPFHGLSAASRATIRELTLRTSVWALKHPHADRLVPLLTARLPSLHALDLEGVEGWPKDDPLRLALFYDALASSCPRLERLTLPSWDTLAPGLGLFAASLTTLDIKSGDDFGGGNSSITRRTVAVISQLTQLRELTLSCCDHAVASEREEEECDVLLLLLNSLPASVTHLALKCSYFRGDNLPHDLIIELQAGLIQSVSTGAGTCSITTLATLANLLLQSTKLGPQLPRLLLTRELLLCHADRHDLADPAADSAIFQLVRRCGGVRLGCLSVVVASESFDAAAALLTVQRAVSVFGMPERLFLGDFIIFLEKARSAAALHKPVWEQPQVVEYGLPTPQQEHQRHAQQQQFLQSRPQQEQPSHTAQPQPGSPHTHVPGSAAGGGDDGTGSEHSAIGVVQAPQSGASPAAALPRLFRTTADELIGDMVDWMAELQLVSDNNDGGGSGGSSSSSSSRSCLVLLRGPLVHGLCAAPKVMTSWVEWLGKKASKCVATAAAAATGGGGAGGNGGGDAVRVISHQALPAAAAVVVQCSSVAGGAAMAAAAGAAGGPTLQAHVLRMTAAQRGRFNAKFGSRRFCLTYLQKEVQKLWSESSDACLLSEQERLWRLVALLGALAAALLG